MPLSASKKREQLLPRIPAYQRIESDLRDRIESGHWRVGQMLPSRRDLAAEYGVDPLTLNRAIAPLLADGCLHADGGRGTFVVRAPLADPAVPAQRIDRTEQKPFTATLGVVAAVGETVASAMAIQDIWVHTVVGSIEKSFSNRGGDTVYLDRYDAKTDTRISAQEAAHTLVRQGAQAIALIFAEDDLAFVRDIPVPVVCVTSRELDCTIPHIFYDNTNAGYQAATHLLGGGCSRLIYLNTTHSMPWISERMRGAEIAASRDPARPAFEIVTVVGGSGVDPEWARCGKLAAELIYPRLNDSQGAHVHPIGVVAPNDAIAAAFIESMKERRIVAPRDYRIVGFDDHGVARTHGLTTLRPPLEEMGIEAGRMLHQAITNEPFSLQVRLRSTLIMRSTSRSPLGGEELNQ